MVYKNYLKNCRLHIAASGSVWVVSLIISSLENGDVFLFLPMGGNFGSDSGYCECYVLLISEQSWFWFFPSPYFFLFLKREWKGGREGEKPRYRDWTHNLGMYPDRESSRRPFALQEEALQTEPHWSGCLFFFFFSFFKQVVNSAELKLQIFGLPLLGSFLLRCSTLFSSGDDGCELTLSFGSSSQQHCEFFTGVLAALHGTRLKDKNWGNLSTLFPSSKCPRPSRICLLLFIFQCPHVAFLSELVIVLEQRVDPMGSTWSY